MKTFKKLVLTVMLGMLSMVALGSLPAAQVDAQAATLEELNDSSAFLKQQGRYTCTLCANAMMLRRASMLRGDSDWRNVTEAAVRPTLWVEGCGMHFDYSYNGFRVCFGKTRNPYSSASELKELLSRHPEGIVAYDYDYPHAILLTDYTDGVFYCAEPANNVASGRITASKALVNVNNIEAYWYIENAVLSVEEKYAPLANRSSLSEYEILTGQSITVNAEASGGSGAYEYAVSCEQVSTGKKTELQSFGSNQRISYTPVEAGLYHFIVQTRDTKTETVSRLGLTLQVYDKLQNTSTLSDTTIIQRQSVKVNGSAVGGAGGEQYAFYCRKASSNGWLTIRDYSSVSTVEYTPVAATEYDFMVRVRDRRGRVAEKLLKLTVNKPLTNRSRIGSTTVAYGEPLQLRGAAVGGTGDYQYAYYCRRVGSKGWYIIKLYSEDTAASYTPAFADDYEVIVRVKDSFGTVSEKSFRVKVASPLENRCILSAETIHKGSNLMIYGLSSGGVGNNEYAFYCRKAGTTGWYTIKSFDQRNTGIYKPVAATQYEVLTRVRDSSGKVSEKILTLKVEK